MTLAGILIILGLAATTFAGLFAWFAPGAPAHRSGTYPRTFSLLVLGIILIGVGALLPQVGH